MRQTGLANFGEGWMTKAAADLCRVLLVFGNVEPITLIKALPSGNRRKLNIRSVEHALMKLRGY
jgi:hypothetical protein